MADLLTICEGVTVPVVPTCQPWPLIKVVFALLVVRNSSDTQFTDGFLDTIQARKTGSECTSKQ